MNAQTSREWPASRVAMIDIIEHLHALGADQSEIVCALMADFPDAPGNANYSAASIECARLDKRPHEGMHLDDDERALDDIARRRSALNLVGELMALGRLPVQHGEVLKIETRACDVVEPLPQSIVDRIALYADELYAIAAMTLMRH